MTLSTLQQRIITSVLLVFALFLALYLGGYVLMGAVTVFSVVALHEFYSMFWKENSRTFSKIIGMISGAAIILTAALASPTWVIILLIGLFWIFNLKFLFSYSATPGRASYSDSLILFSGLIYIPLTLQFLTSMNSWEILFVLLSSSASDTAAFYAGTYFGKKKIWPRISPKKSWAGSIGGFIACIICCTVYGRYLGNASILSWVILAASLNIASQMGDFFESALKRKLDVKDSGKILPGHGGVLDRIDSLVLALPVYILARQLHAFF
ncbi:phosphatidate cytidylyltransferase [Maridesulfovibrio ferrireducens]|uniref:Phosphatidate cytidylyltransferase n=1 Tax=Maridesulfovibrio ferrireducens TaxID=246191 RepID=A0A1G9F2E7_9BACT|nr:phosphatidate cytidylyltransferase [Maridesulfovibrio ferrireducens]SDK82577.1 phosphatidate cytidylyltransferase [Maridesulfovibrio ferrireducens]